MIRMINCMMSYTDQNLGTFGTEPTYDLVRHFRHLCNSCNTSESSTKLLLGAAATPHDMRNCWFAPSPETEVHCSEEASTNTHMLMAFDALLSAIRATVRAFQAVMVLALVPCCSSLAQAVTLTRLSLRLFLQALQPAKAEPVAFCCRSSALCSARHS